MKSSLRKLIIDDQQYLWRFSASYLHTGDPLKPYHCNDHFVAWLVNFKQSSLRIDFLTWADPIVGGPLRSGAPLIIGDDNSPRINLYQPGWAAAVIKAAGKLGWQPALAHKPMHIQNGVEFLQQLWATPEKNSSNKII